MSKSPMVNDTGKCLKCGTYHSLDQEHCSVGGRYLYIIGGIYRPRIRKGGKIDK